jgi:hypothetical protein
MYGDWSFAPCILSYGIYNKRVHSARYITHSLRVGIYKTIIRPMERDLMMCKRKILRKIYGPRYEND